MAPSAGRARIPEASKGSDPGIARYLMPDENLMYSTKDRVTVEHETGLWGYVTSNRVLFYARRGLIMKSDQLIEIPLESIHFCKIVKLGRKFRRMYLALNDFIVRGDRTDLVEMYRAVLARQKCKFCTEVTPED